MERRLQGKWLDAIRYILIVSALFHFASTAFGYLPDMRQRAVHVVFTVGLVFLMYSATKRAKATNKIPVWDILLGLVVIASAINVYVKYIPFHIDPLHPSILDIFLGVSVIILVIEAGRRVIGWVFPSLTLFFVLYAVLGPYIPGDFGHGGVPWRYLLIHLYVTDYGVWGMITGISATIAAIFLILGGFLLHTGTGEVFMAIAVKLTGKMRGGPALTAVVASGLFGTISGGATNNVITTGNFTIPMMKRLGYKPEFAGAVETTASTGGPLMPPIMGTCAFIMAEFLGISYLTVIIAGSIPAILYYVAVFCSVRFESVKLNLAPIPADEIPSWRQILTWGKIAPLVIPFTVLLALLVKGYYIATCGFWAVVSLAVLFFFSNFSLSGMRQRASMLVDGLERGGSLLAGLAPLMVCANIVISLVTLTGIGVKIGDLIMNIAGQSMLLALIFTAIGCIIFGMGIPINGSYILGVAILYPALARLGLAPLVGHYFIMYFAAMSSITPPVCLASYVAAAIAQASWLRVAWIGMRLGIVVFLLPFVFSYDPALLILGNVELTPFPAQQILMVTLTALVGTVFASAGVWGYLHTRLSVLTRMLFIPGAFLLLVPGVTTDLWGLALVFAGLFSQTVISLVRKRLGQRPPPSSDLT